MEYKSSKLNENEIQGKTVFLNNEEVSVKDFNKELEGLKGNQRVLESSENNFHIVERLFS